MARRRCFLHIDLAGLTGHRLGHELMANREILRDLGFKTPVHQVLEAELASIELRRTHAERGLSRREVEGQWAQITRRIWKGRRIPVLSVPGLGKCTPEQTELAIDALAGLKLTVLVSVPAVATPTTQAAVAEVVHHWRTRTPHGRILLQPVRGADDWAPVLSAFADISGISEAASQLVWARPVAA